MLLQYLSAIFYNISAFPENVQKLFYLNPVYLYISYFRKVVLYAEIPSLGFHLLMLGEAIAVFLLGIMIYRRYNMKFLYYV